MIFIINYEPFWNTLKKKNISQYALIHKYHFSTGTLDALRKIEVLHLILYMIYVKCLTAILPML